MRIVRPFAITDANMTSNATESVAAWDSGTSYTAGQQAGYGERIYEAIQNGSNKRPDLYADYWFVVGPTNKWAMFDDKTGTQTVRADDLAVAVDVDGYADTVGLLNFSAASLNVTVHDDDAVEVFNEDISLVDDQAVTDYYEYFFEPVIRRTDIVVPITPDVYNPTISVTLTDAGEDVKVGHMVVGQSRWIGDAQYGATIGIIDYSRIDEDEYGNTYITERSFSRRGRFTVWFPASLSDEINRITSSYRATPVLIIGTEKFGSTLYFGLLREAEIEFAYPTYSIMSLEVRGLG